MIRRKDFLWINHYKAIKIYGGFISAEEVACEVPQGSLLESVLFNLFNNDPERD